MTWLRKLLSKKLVAFILTPVLMGVLMAINKFMGNVWTEEQMNLMINKIIAPAVALIVTGFSYLFPLPTAQGADIKSHTKQVVTISTAEKIPEKRNTKTYPYSGTS